MVKYMKDHEMESYTMMRMLCDDIYIVYKTIGKLVGAMFANSRQCSQGHQYSYACSVIPNRDNDDDYDYKYNNKTPYHTQDLFDEMEQNEMEQNEMEQNEMEQNEMEQNEMEQNEMEQNEMEQNEMTPYLSFGVATFMKEVSGDNIITGSTETQKII